jgi:hypothetical protein
MLCERGLLGIFHGAQFGGVVESTFNLLNLRFYLSLDLIEELWGHLRLALKVSPDGFLDDGNYFIRCPKLR